jgi:hypothetical protein
MSCRVVVVVAVVAEGMIVVDDDDGSIHTAFSINENLPYNVVMHTSRF